MKPGGNLVLSSKKKLSQTPYSCTRKDRWKKLAALPWKKLFSLLNGYKI
jgi:hypothetical protein